MAAASAAVPAAALSPASLSVAALTLLLACAIALLLRLTGASPERHDAA